MKCKHCYTILPKQRIELGYVECVECSTEDVYGTVGITYHKTGNTLQHVDKATATKINKASRRNTYGSNLGTIKSGGYEEFKRKIDIGCSTATVGSEAMFNRIGEEALFKLDLLGLDKALDFVERKFKSASLNFNQYEKLKKVLISFAG